MIQWFPGHMAKARREVEEKLKLVDIVIELVDARAPYSSQNPLIQEAVQQKPKMMVLMKKDLADERKTKEWLTAFNEMDRHALAMNVNEPSDIKRLIQLVKEKGNKVHEQYKEKGIQSRPIRAMIVGIPNVGKSTLINRLANKKIAKIGARPGVTRKQLWIKVANEFELLDTPGILLPKFTDDTMAYRLAIIGTIKDDLLPLQDVAAFLLKYINEYYPNSLIDRYQLIEEIDDMWDMFVAIGKKRGALESGGHVNFDKVADIVLQDFRSGRLGKISLESVSDKKDMP